MTPVYKIIQDVTGLGSTGEVLVGRKTGNLVEFLNPLRHDPKAALTRKATLGDQNGFPIQQAVQGKTGAGLAIDYRGKQGHCCMALHSINGLGLGRENRQLARHLPTSPICETLCG